jgi:hypothetical protein
MDSVTLLSSRARQGDVTLKSNKNTVLICVLLALVLEISVGKIDMGI